MSVSTDFPVEQFEALKPEVQPRDNCCEWESDMWSTCFHEFLSHPLALGSLWVSEQAGDRICMVQFSTDAFCSS